MQVMLISSLSAHPLAKQRTVTAAHVLSLAAKEERNLRLRLRFSSMATVSSTRWPREPAPPVAASCFQADTSCLGSEARCSSESWQERYDEQQRGAVRSCFKRSLYLPASQWEDSTSRCLLDKSTVFNNTTSLLHSRHIDLTTSKLPH